MKLRLVYHKYNFFLLHARNQLQMAVKFGILYVKCSRSIETKVQ